MTPVTAWSRLHRVLPLQFHPDMDRFIDEYIAEVNDRAADYNAMLDVWIGSASPVVSTAVCASLAFSICMPFPTHLRAYSGAPSRL